MRDYVDIRNVYLSELLVSAACQARDGSSAHCPWNRPASLPASFSHQLVPLGASPCLLTKPLFFFKLVEYGSITSRNIASQYS
jgi:hypothetical protein